MSTLTVPIRIKRGIGTPGTLKQGELAFDETGKRLFIGSGVGTGGNAATVVELTTPPVVLEQLSNVAITSGPNDGDVLTYDASEGEWIAQAVAAASVAWADVTGKPTVFTPDTHSHAWGDITSGVPATFAPSAHASSHATGGADAIAPADIGAAAASHSHGSVSNDGKIGSTAGLVLKTGADGVIETLALGTAGQVLKVNSGATGVEWGTDATGDGSGVVDIATDPIWSAKGDLVAATGNDAAVAVAVGTNGQALVADSTAAAGIAWKTLAAADVGASATGHTHDAATTSVAGFMSSSDKTKLDGIATGAEVNVNADWNASSGDAQILNKPTLGTAAAAATTDFIAASAASAFGLTLIDDADASAARTTLGLGSAATSASGDFAAASHSHAWGDITSGVPSTFTPSSHTHGNISNDGKIGTTADALVKTGSDGTLTTLGLGFTDQYLKTGVSGPEWASLPSTFAPSAHNHGVTVTLELSGFIEAPEGKTYVLSPAIPAAITITNFKARTGAGSCDIKLQDDGTDITNATLDDVDSDALAEPVSEISASVASGSRLTLVVSDATSSAPEDLAFTVHYTTTVTSANNA